MPNVLNVKTAAKAIEVLEEGIATIQRESDEQIAELRRVIANLNNGNGTPLAVSPGKTNGKLDSAHRAAAPIYDHQYRGMKKSLALEVYMRSRRNEGKLALAGVVADLLQGGADLGTLDRHERNIILVIKNKPKLYGYDDKTRELWLADTADDESRPKPRTAKSILSRREVHRHGVPMAI